MGNRNKKGHIFDQATIRVLNGIPLPDKVKCDRCQKFRAHAMFSKTQIWHAKAAVKKNGPGASYKIHCIRCTGGQIVEIECAFCGKTKGLEEFAKVQRNKPDRAKCYACTEDQLELEPVEDEKYEDPRDAFTEIDPGDGTYPVYWAPSSTHTNASEAGDQDDSGGIDLTNNFAKLNMSSSTTGTLIDSEYTYPHQYTGYNDSSNGGPVKLGGDEWTVAKTKSWHTGSSTPSASSGFNPNKYGNPAGRSGTPSASGSAHTFPSNFTEPSDTQPVTVKGGWAKIKAYKPPTKPEPVVEEDWSSEEEGDNGDDTDHSDTEI